MAKQHGKVTVVKIDGDDLSQYSDNSDLKITGDAHDVTTYGKDSHVFAGGLKNGSATVTGFYDTTASTGPRAVLLPLVGTVVPFIHQPEGTGASLPQDSVQVLVTEYSQSHPVADMVKWSVSLQFSDDVNSTAQSA
jgi:hypothetical protein